MRWDEGLVKEWLDRARDPDLEEEVLEPEGEPGLLSALRIFMIC